MKLINSSLQLGQKEKHIARLAVLENATVTNIQMRSGEEIVEHHSKKDALVIVRKGKVRFVVEGEEVIVTPETVLYMVPLEDHSLYAIEDTDLVLLQITP